MNSTGESSMQDIEASVLIKLLAVVIWCDKCGVKTNGTDFSIFVLLRAPQFTIRQYSVL